MPFRPPEFYAHYSSQISLAINNNHMSFSSVVNPRGDCCKSRDELGLGFQSSAMLLTSNGGVLQQCHWD
jgi:hypothetical protein